MTLCVILPVYNAQKYLHACLDSLFAQTFQDFTVLALNDASTDDSGAILDEYAKAHPNLHVFHFAQNRGDPAMTQFAFEHLNTMNVAFVARMDADDVCEPERFAKQIEFLKANPDIDVLGGNVSYLDDVGAVIEGMTDVPLSDGLIKVKFLSARANIVNPTTMWRKCVHDVPLRYDVAETACDYAMWVELALRGKRFANLPDVLVRYRLHPNQASRQVDKVQQSVRWSLRRYLTALFAELDEADITSLMNIGYGLSVSLSVEEYLSAINAYERIENRTTSILGEDRVKAVAYFGDKINDIKTVLRQHGVAV